MYYEEKLIAGRWHYRSSPDGEWVPYSCEELQVRYTALREYQMQLAALSPTWTTTRPEQPGWYWYKRGNSIDICRVLDFDIRENTFEEGIQWSGPIREPK